MSAATSLLPGPRRVEEFARFLESGQTPVDAGLARLVDLAHGLEALPQPAGPRPEFRAALRQRLVAVASVQAMQADVPEQRRSPETASVRSRARRVQRSVALASGALAGVVAVSGVGIAASRSLPGDPLYGVKKAAESVQLWFTSGAYDRGKRHLEFAQTRLHELRQLARDGGSASSLTEALRDMDAETLAGSRDLTRAYAVDHRRDALTVLDRFSREQGTALRAVLPELPSTARPAAQASLQLLATVVDRATALARQGAAVVGTGSTSSTGSAGTPSGAPLQDQLGVVPKPLQSLSALLPGGGSTSTGGSTGTTPQSGPSGGTGTDTGSNPQPGASSDIGSDLGSTLGGVVGNLPSPAPSTSSTTSGGTTGPAPLPLPLPLPSVSLAPPLGSVTSPLPAPSDILSTTLAPLPGTSSLTVPLP